MGDRPRGADAARPPQANPADLAPHPYALLLPPLTNDEYAALRAHIERHGIMHPAILADDGRILDGVHRCRIAAELDIPLPVSQMGRASEQDKRSVALGINVRRRHLDPERRRELVRRLNREGLTVREIAEVTGWSKSTVGRDLTPPAPTVPTGTAGPESFDATMRRWEREHPEPRREDFYSDDADHVGQFRYHAASIAHIREHATYFYRRVLDRAGELSEEGPDGLLLVALAAAAVRFYTAETRAEAPDSTPEDRAEVQQAWVAYVAARDAVAALDGRPHGDDRPIEVCDFLYHPAFEEWRNEANEAEQVQG